MIGGRDPLPGACAPPHKGRGRGPLDTSSRVSGDAGDNGRGRKERSDWSPPGGYPFLRPHMDEVYLSSGPGPLLFLGPGPAGIASRPFYGTIGGPGPAIKMGPRPRMGWTRSKQAHKKRLT